MEKKKLTSKKALAAPPQPPVAAQQKTVVDVESEEKALRKMRQLDNKKKIQRITVDMPAHLYELIKTETEKKGYSITGFMIALTRKYFGEE